MLTEDGRLSLSRQVLFLAGVGKVSSLSTKNTKTVSI